MKTNILFLIVIIITISSCRKYPEGGSYFLTDMTKKIAGEYSFTHYYIDGVDSVNYYFNNDYFSHLIFNKIESDKMPDCYLLFYKNINYSPIFDLGGNWDWNNSKKTELITYLGTSEPDTIFYAGPFSQNLKTIWNIKKLKDNELILETDYNNKHYRAELKK